MPRFFFDVLKNDELKIDHEGNDFPDDETAHREAVMAIAEMAAEEIPRDGPLSLTISVANHDHRILFRTKVMFEPGSCETHDKH